MTNKALFLVLYALTAIAHAEENLPFDLEKLISQRARAIEKIDIAYIQELEKLKERYTKKGDLKVANVIVALIENRAVGSNDKLDPIVGVWKWPTGTYGVCFPDGTLYVFDSKGGKFNCQWKFLKLGKKYQFTWNDGTESDAVMEGEILLPTSGRFKGLKISKES